MQVYRSEKLAQRVIYRCLSSRLFIKLQQSVQNDHRLKLTDHDTFVGFNGLSVKCWASTYFNSPIFKT